MNLKPLGDRLLVRLLSSEKKSPGGIHIPDSANEYYRRARVIDIGPGRENERGDIVKVKTICKDNTVIFNLCNAHRVSIDAEEHYLIKAGDVDAIVEG